MFTYNYVVLEFQYECPLVSALAISSFAGSMVIFLPNPIYYV